jgi:hypothetical protein
VGGKGAAALGLGGQVDPDVIGRLYQHNIGPSGELPVKRRQDKAAEDRETAAVTAYLTAHPYASALELAEVQAAERGKDPHQVPYFDLTVSAVKSVSVLHASYRVAARQAQEWAGGTGHLLNLWTAAVRQTLHPDIDQQIKARLTETEAWRYEREHSRQAQRQRLRAAQLAGHDIAALIDRITAAPMDRARSIASVLHGRLQRLALPQLAGHDATWAQRTPAGAPAVARELAAALDDRVRALGEQLAASPEPWLARQLGVLVPNASPALREEYARRAGAAAAYREAAGITDPDQAVSLEPHHGNPELENMRKAVFTALGIRDEVDVLRGLHRGELESRILAGKRAHASAPPDMSRTLRLTAQAEADALQQTADAEVRRDEPGAASGGVGERGADGRHNVHRPEARTVAASPWSWYAPNKLPGSRVLG